MRLKRGLRVLTVVGARPQFIKAAVMSNALRVAGHTELLVHTGQHYDHKMSQAFFDELEMPAPHVNLEVGSGTHAEQTAKMLVGIEGCILREKPDAVILYGDTNSTLAGALVAAKLHLQAGHVEAGLRSFNRRMPEEVNRVVTDALATVLWPPSDQAVRNLAAEGILEGVEMVGDIMVDALAKAALRADGSDILQRLCLRRGEYLLVTIHRAESTNAADLTQIIDALEQLEEIVVMPIHPRTRSALERLGRPPKRLRLVEPVGHAEMVALTRAARLVLTDSGGLQKEAYWLGVPCVTLRSETEWVETVAAGWNVLVGTDPEKIVNAVRTHVPPAHHPTLYGDGSTAARCVSSLERALSHGNDALRDTGTGEP